MTGSGGGRRGGQAGCEGLPPLHSSSTSTALAEHLCVECARTYMNAWSSEDLSLFPSRAAAAGVVSAAAAAAVVWCQSMVPATRW
jgi:hypothetical protein